MRRWLVPALAPLLLTLYPLLYLYANNIAQLSVDDLVKTLLICVAATLVVFALLSAVLRSVHRGAVLTAIAVILFYGYGHVHSIVNPSSHRYLLIVWAAVLVAGIALVLRYGERLNVALTYLTLVAGVLVVMQAVQIGAYLVNTASRSPVDIETQTLAFEPVTLDTPPDIYYIVLDGYARADILQEYYELDNTLFVEALEAQGFYVAPESRSNYTLTFLSLASSLNMTYLTPNAQEGTMLGTERSIPYTLIQNGQVWDFLDSAGYMHIQLSSGWGATDFNPYADINYVPGSFNEFEVNLLKTTLLKPFYLDTVIADSRHRILSNFETLAQIAAMPEPTFTLAHFLLPHPPYLFDRQGNIAQHEYLLGGDYVWSLKDGYRDQVIFANAQILALVERILDESDVPPIIIVQGDHGTASGGGWLERDPALVRERTSILNAYYMPDTDALYPSITPVNTFRVIFDTYFGQSFGLLEDHVYFSDYDHPYQFDEIP